MQRLPFKICRTSRLVCCVFERDVFVDVPDEDVRRNTKGRSRSSGAGE